MGREVEVHDLMADTRVDRLPRDVNDAGRDQVAVRGHADYALSDGAEFDFNGRLLDRQKGSRLHRWNLQWHPCNSRFSTRRLVDDHSSEKLALRNKGGSWCSICTQLGLRIPMDNW